jgi:hypothetical protein
MRKLVCHRRDGSFGAAALLRSPQLAAAGQVRDRVGTFAEIFWKEVVARACAKPGACSQSCAQRLTAG